MNESTKRNQPENKRFTTHLDPEICMKQSLEVKCPVSLVLDPKGGLQAVFGQCHTIYESKVVRPRLAEPLAQHRRRQTKVELHSIVPFPGIIAK
jgi:hypothetical protein